MLQAKQIRCQRGEKTLFRDLRFVLNPGQALHIKGVNGVGKTSLLRIVSGLLAPDSGEINYQGSGIHFIADKPAVRSELTVWENLNYLAALLCASSEYIDQAINSFNLAEQANTYVSNLSYGQQQRVGLAQLLLKPAKLWLLDEPATGLDQEGISVLEHLIEQQLNVGGMVIFSSHQPLQVTEVQELVLT